MDFFKKLGMIEDDNISNNQNENIKVNELKNNNDEINLNQNKIDIS